MSFDEIVDRANDYLELKIKCKQLVEKWRSTEKSHDGVKCHAWKVCADELESALKGASE